jgi:hypothetical protein
LSTQNRFGYQKGQSASIDNIIECFENRNYYTSVICFLELSKAFDSVSHTNLISKQAFFYSIITSATLIVRYLHNRAQPLSVNHTLSKDGRIMQGMPQGYVGVLTLFIIFVNSDQQHRKVIPDY